MIFLLLLALAAVSFSSFLVLKQVFLYFRDTKRLRQFPALTRLGGVTSLSYIAHVFFFESFRSRSLQKAHEAHKGTNALRLTPEYISFNSPGAIKDIYGHGTTCLKGDHYDLIADGHYNVFTTTSKPDHVIKRKRVAAAFATKNLLVWQYKVLDKIERLVTQFDRRCSDPASVVHPTTHWDNSEGITDMRNAQSNVIDVRQWFDFFTIDAISHIALDDYGELMENGHDMVLAEDAQGKIYHTPFIACKHGGNNALMPFSYSAAVFPWSKWVTKKISPEMHKQTVFMNNFGDIVRYKVKRRLELQKEGMKSDDFMDSLLTDRYGKSLNLDLDELLAEFNIFLDAGSDTTTIALTHVMWRLCLNPSKLAKLREEIDPYFANHIDDVVGLSYDSLRDCAYLRACIDESLRLNPPLSAGQQRKTPKEGAWIDGRFIEGDVLVSVPAYAAHRNEEVFPDPESFWPERWLDERNKGDFLKNFIAFSTGARVCLGRNITYIEQTMLVATLVHRYNFAIADPSFEMEWQEQYNLWPKRLPLRLTRRSPPSLVV